MIFVCACQLLITCSLKGFTLRGTAVTSYRGNELSVVIPDGVTEINFHGSYSCTSIDVPSSVTKIYMMSSNITSLNIADGVTEITMHGCNAITSLDIPDGVTNVSITDCTSLTSVTIPGSVKGINTFGGCTALTSLTIENGVEKITAYAFKDCPLTRVELPQSVIEVYVSSFRNSSELSVYMHRSTRLINEFPSLPVYTNFYRYR